MAFVYFKAFKGIQICSKQYLYYSEGFIGDFFFIYIHILTLKSLSSFEISFYFDKLANELY